MPATPVRAALVVVVIAASIIAWLQFASRPVTVPEEESAEDRRRAITDAFEGEAVESSVTEIREITAMFAAVRDALSRQDIAGVVRHVDGELLLAAIEQQGGAAPAGTQRRAGALASIFVNDQIWPSKECRVKNVRFLEGRTEVVAYVRHRSEDGATTKTRWWISGRSGTWRVYDYEDLSFSQRISAALAASLSRPELRQELTSGVRSTSRAARHLQEGSAREARLELESFQFPGTLRSFEAMRRFLLGLAHSGAGEWDAAIGELRAALQLNPDIPQAHLDLARALTEAGRAEEALTHTRRYMEAVGVDPEVHIATGSACTALGRSREGESYARLALEEDPSSIEAALALAAALPAERKKEVAVAFDPAAPAAPFHEVAARFLAEDEVRALAALVDSYPEWVRAEERDGSREGGLDRLRELAEKLAERDEYGLAAQVLGQVLRIVPDDGWSIRRLEAFRAGRAFREE